MSPDFLSSEDNNQNISSKIFHFQNTLLNRTLTVSLIVTIFGISISFIRIGYTGFQAAFYFQLIAIGSLLLVTLLKNKLSYCVKLYSFILMQLLTVIGGVLSYGLMAGATVFLICACAMAVIFAGKKLTLTIFTIGVLIIISFGWLYCSGFLESNFNQFKYMHSFTSWINFLSSFIMSTVLIVALTSGLIKRLKIMIIESVQHNDQIQSLNNSLERRVEQRTKELSDLNKQKDQILGMVAHDINNKLGGVLGYLDLINNANDTLDNKTRSRFVSKALDAGSDAQNILKDLLEFASNNKEKRPLSFEHVNILQFVSDSIECHYPKSVKKNIGIKIDSQSTPCKCAINREKMSRVIDNLITNALKFTPSGGTISISIFEQDSSGIIKVSDSGIGIPDHLKPDLFTPFSSSGRDGTALEKSNGLGLSISKQIVEFHSGSIWFESEEGKGSTFYFTIPENE